MDAMPCAKVAKTFYGCERVPFEYRGKLAWGTLRQYGRWPLDRHERETVRDRGRIPCDATKEWDENFTTFALSNLDKEYFEPVSDEILLHRLEYLDTELEKISWYSAMGISRRCVILDIAYKSGLSIVMDRDLSQAAKASQWDKISAIIKTDAGREYRKPSDLEPYGSRSWLLCEIMANDKLPKWAED